VAEGSFFLEFGSDAAQFADKIDAQTRRIQSRFEGLKQSLTSQVTEINAILKTLGRGEEINLAQNIGLQQFTRLAQNISEIMEDGVKRGITNSLRNMRISGAIEIPVKLVAEDGRPLAASSPTRTYTTSVNEEPAGQRGRPASLGLSAAQVQSIRDARAAMVDLTDYLRKTRDAVGQANTGLERFIATLQDFRAATGDARGFAGGSAVLGSPAVASAASAEALAHALVPALQRLAESSGRASTRTAAEPANVASFVKDIGSGIERVLERFVDTRVGQLVEKQASINPNVDRSVLAGAAADRANIEAQLFRAMLEPQKFFAPKDQGGFGLTQGVNLNDLLGNVNRLVYEAGRRLINAQLPHEGPVDADTEAVISRRLGFARLSDAQRLDIRSNQGGQYDPFNAAASTGEVVRELLKIAQSAGVLREDISSLDSVLGAINAVVREHTEAESAGARAATENAEAQGAAASSANTAAEALDKAATGALNLAGVAEALARVMQEQVAVAAGRGLGGATGERQAEFYQRSNALRGQFLQRATNLIPEEQRGALFRQLGLPGNFVFPDTKQIGPILQGLKVPNLDTKLRELEFIGTQLDAIQGATEQAIRKIAEPNPRLNQLLEQARTGQEQIFGKYDAEDKPNATAKQVESDEKALRALQSAGVRVALPDLVDRLLPNGRLPGVIDPSATQIATQGSSIPATKGRGSGFVDNNLGATFFPEHGDRLDTRVEKLLSTQQADLTPAQYDDIRHFQEAQDAVRRIYARIQEFKKTYTPIVQELIQQPGFTLGQIPTGTPLRALAEGLSANFATGKQIYSDDLLDKHILETAARYPDVTGSSEGNRVSRVAALFGRDELFDAAASRTGDISQMTPEEAAAYIQSAGLDAQRTASREGGGFSRTAIRGSLTELLQGQGIQLKTSNLNRIPEAKALPGLDRGTPGTKDKLQEFNRALRDFVVNMERLVRVAPEEVPGAFQKQFGNVADLYTRLTGQDLGTLDDGLAAGQRALARTKTAASRTSGAGVTYTPADIAGGPKTREQITQDLLAKAERSRQEQEERQSDLARAAVRQDLLLEQLKTSDLLNIPAASLLEPVDTARFGLGEGREVGRLDTPAIAQFLSSAEAHLPEGSLDSIRQLRALRNQQDRVGNIFGAGALSTPLEQLAHVGRLQQALGGLQPGDTELLGKKFIDQRTADSLYAQVENGSLTPSEPGKHKAATKDEELAYKVLNGDMQVIENQVADRLSELDKALRAAGVENGHSAIRSNTIQQVLDQIIANAVTSVERVLRRLAAELSGTGITQLGTGADLVSRRAGRQFDLSLGFGGFDENGRPKFNTGDFDPYLRAAASADLRGVRASVAEDIGQRGLHPAPERGDVIGGLSPELRTRLGLGGLEFPEAPGGAASAVAEQLVAVAHEEIAASEHKTTATEKVAAAMGQVEAETRKAASAASRTSSSKGTVLREHIESEFPELHAALSSGDFPGAASQLRGLGFGASKVPDIKSAYGLKPEEAGALAGEMRKLVLVTASATAEFEKLAGAAEAALINSTPRVQQLAQRIRSIGEASVLAGGLTKEHLQQLGPLYEAFNAELSAAPTAQRSRLFGQLLGQNPGEFKSTKDAITLAGLGGGGAGGSGGGGIGLGAGAGGEDPGAGGVLSRLLFGKNGNGSILERQLLSVGRTFTRFSSDMLIFAGFAKFQQIATDALQLEKEFTRMGAALQAVDGSAAGLSTLRGSLAGIATSLGAPLTDVVKTASEFIGVFSKVRDIEFATKITEQLKLISLGALSSEEAFRGISSIISGYQANNTFPAGLNIQSLSQVGNYVAQASSITGTNVADIIQGAGRLAPEAAALNIKPAQLITLTADVAKRSGQSGEAAGEQLSRAFSTLQTSKVQNLLEKFGVASEEQFNQGQYGDVLSQLLNKFPSLNKSQQASLREAIGSGRQAAVVNALFGDSRGVQRDINNVAENSPGALNRRTDTILKTFSQQISIFEQNIQALANLIVRSGVLDGLGLLFIALNKVFSIFIALGNGLNKLFEDTHLSWLRDVITGFGGLALAGTLLSKVFSTLPALVNKAAGGQVATSIAGALTYLTGGRGGGAISASSRIREAFAPAGAGIASGAFVRNRFDPIGGANQALTEVSAALTGAAASIKARVTGTTVAKDVVAEGAASRAATRTALGLGDEAALLSGAGGAAVASKYAVNPKLLLPGGIGAEAAPGGVGAEGAAAAGVGLSGLELGGVGLAAAIVYMGRQHQNERQKSLDDSIKQITSGQLDSKQQNELAANTFKKIDKQEKNPGLVDQIYQGNSIQPGLSQFSDAYDELKSANDFFSRGNLRGGIHRLVFGMPKPKSTTDQINQIIQAGNSTGTDAPLQGRFAVNKLTEAQRTLNDVNAQLAPLEDGSNFKKLVDGAGPSKSARAKASQALTQVKTALEDRKNALQSILAGYDGIIFSVGAATSTNSVVGSLKNLSPNILKNKNYQNGIQALIDNSQVPAGVQKDIAVLRDPTAGLAKRNNAEISIKQQEIESLRQNLSKLKPEDQATAMQIIAQDLADIDSLGKQIVDSGIQEAQTLAQIAGNRLNYGAEAADLGKAIAGLSTKIAGETDPAAKAADLAQQDQLRVQQALAGHGKAIDAADATSAGAAGSAAKTNAEINAVQQKIAALTGVKGGESQLKDLRNQLAGLQVTAGANSIAAQAAAGQVKVGQLQLSGNQSGAQAQTVSNARNAYAAAVKQYGAGTAEANNAYAAYLQAEVQNNQYLTSLIESKGQVLVARLNLAGRKSAAQQQAARNAAQAYQDAVRLYGTNSAEANSALAASINAQATARDALLQSLKGNLDLQLSKLGLSTKGNIAGKEATARLNEAKKELATFLQNGGSKGSDDYKALQAQVNNAQRAQFDAKLQDSLDTLDFQHEMLKISASQEIAALQEILKQKTLTLAERRSIMLKIKELGSSIEAQFNFGSIKIPTPYEVRRFIKAGAGAGTSTTVVNNTFTINGADTDKVVALLTSKLGSPATTRLSTGSRKF
jgi:hypothetical protein